MTKISYLISRIKDTSYSNWFMTAAKVGKLTHKPSPVVFFDMLRCAAKYGCGYVDYDIYGMYKMTEEQKANVLTVGKNHAYVKELNNSEKREIFVNKILFNKVFKDFIKRDWVELTGDNFDEFAKTCEGRDRVIAKPVDLCCGTGIQMIKLADEPDLRALYNRLYAAGAILVEEVVLQDETMSTLCTTCVNTIRMETILNDAGEATLVMAAVKMGREGNYVDNINFGGYQEKKGGLAAVVDPETGIVLEPGFDRNRDSYEYVPVLGTKLVGFQIPRWDECVQFVKDAAKVVPEVKFIGWDLAISRDRGLLLIEGNEFPGNSFQLPSMDIGTDGAIKRALGRA